MVSNLAMAGIATAIALSIGGPIAVYLICRKRMTLSWRNIVIGAGVFFLFALVLEQALHYFVLQANPVTVGWIRSNPWNYVAYGVAAAALFEEGGRYLAMRLLVKDTGKPGTGVAYGIGHGGLEALLLGALAQIQFLMTAIMLNQGRLEAMLNASVPPAQLAMLRHQLETATFFDVTYGGIERVVALLAQIGFSLLVWKAVSERKIVYLFAAMTAHAVLDIPPAMVQIGLMGLFPMQIILMAEGFALLAFFVWCLPRRQTPAAA
jgi:uncharacterized membrane protein YhfC